MNKENLTFGDTENEKKIIISFTPIKVLFLKKCRCRESISI